MAKKVVVQVDADGRGFNRTMGGVNKSVEGMSAKLKGAIAGAFAVGALKTMVTGVVEFADQMDKAAKSVQLTGERMQGLSHIANKAGVEQTKLNDMLNKMNILRAKAKAGDAGAATTLAEMGVRADGEGDAVTMLATAAASGASLATLARAFGDEGVRSFELLKDSLEDVDKQIEVLRENGKIMMDEVLEQLVEAKDQWTDLVRSIQIALAPGVAEGIKGIKAGFEGLTASIAGFAAFLIELRRRFFLGKGVYDAQDSYVQELRDAQAKGVKLSAQELHDLESQSPLEEMIDKVTDAMAESIVETQNQYESSKPKKQEEQTDAQTDTQTKAIKAFDLTSDKLIEMGNFIGIKDSLLQQIQSKQYDEMTNQTTLQKTISENLQLLVNNNQAQPWVI